MGSAYTQVAYHRSNCGLGTVTTGAVTAVLYQVLRVLYSYTYVFEIVFHSVVKVMTAQRLGGEAGGYYLPAILLCLERTSSLLHRGAGE